MSKPIIAIAIFLCSLLIDSTIFADEFGVVTSLHAYIVDQDDEVIETLTTFATVDIVTDGDPWLYVR